MGLKDYLLSEFDEDGDEAGIAGRKASHVTKACNACKRRKAKCDRQRPSCGPCQLRREKCEFTEGDRRHHPDRQFVDSLEQRNKALEQRNRALDGQLDTLVRYLQKMGLDLPPGVSAPTHGSSQSRSMSPKDADSSMSPEAVSQPMVINQTLLPLSPRPSPLREEEILLQDSKPKLIRDERGNHSMYGATSALQHLSHSDSPSAGSASLGSHSTPGSHPNSNSPTSLQSSHSSPPPAQPLTYEHTRHLPYELHLSLEEHEALLLCLFRVLPAYMKHHSSAFLQSMRRTLQYVAPPTPSEMPSDLPYSFMAYSFPDNIGGFPQDSMFGGPSISSHFPEPTSASYMFAPTVSNNIPPPQITPHYSPMLHNSTLALAMAYSANPDLSDAEQRREVAQMAKANLETELSLPSLTGVKSLAYLANFHAGMADHALGWQYFGMCVRMAQALGLNLDCTSLVESGDISESLQRERNLTFWSVYIQDKLWSLWFGRTVALPEGSYDIAIPEPDAALDLLPLNAGDGVDDTTELGCQPAFLSSTFVQTCKLMIIASKILTSIYGTNRSVDMGVVSKLRLELDEWHNKLPPALHYSTTTLSASIPHILTLQMIFNWLIILLDRPFYRSVTQPLHQEPAVRRCDAALRRLVRLFRSWHESHGLRYCTVEHSSIIFTAGATFLLSAVQYKPLSEKKRKEGLDGVRWCVRLLKEMGLVWPAAMEKGAILCRLQRKFINSVDASDPNMPIEVQRGEELHAFPHDALGEPSWADLQLEIPDDNIIPQFVIEPSGFAQGRTYGDIPYPGIFPSSPLSAMDPQHPLSSSCNTTLGADFFLTTLYQFMDNYDTVPQHTQYQAPVLEENAEQQTADQEYDEDVGSPLLEGWALPTEEELEREHAAHEAQQMQDY